MIRSFLFSCLIISVGVRSCEGAGASAPANDECVNAFSNLTVAGGTFTLRNVNTYYATTSSDPTGCGGSSYDVWFRTNTPFCAGWRITATTCYQVTGSYDTVLSVHTSCGTAPVVCNNNDASCRDGNYGCTILFCAVSSTVSYTHTGPSTPLYLRLGGYRGSLEPEYGVTGIQVTIDNPCVLQNAKCGNITDGCGQSIVCGPPCDQLPSDDCSVNTMKLDLSSGSVVVPPVNFRSFTDSAYYGKSWTGCAYDITYDGWYRTADPVCAGWRLTASTCGHATFDTMLALYSVCPTSSSKGYALACNDDDPSCNDAGSGGKTGCGATYGSCSSTVSVVANTSSVVYIRVGFPQTPSTPSMMNTGLLVTVDNPCVVRGLSCGNVTDGCGNVIVCGPPCLPSFICSAAPPLDLSTGYVLTGIFNTTKFNTDSAQVTCSSAMFKDGWYRTASMVCPGWQLTASTCNYAQFDTMLSIHDNCTTRSLACNDDDVACSTNKGNCGSYSCSSTVSYNKTGTPSYLYVRVGGPGSYPTSSGMTALELSLTDPCTLRGITCGNYTDGCGNVIPCGPPCPPKPSLECVNAYAVDVSSGSALLPIVSLVGYTTSAAPSTGTMCPYAMKNDGWYKTSAPVCSGWRVTASTCGYARYDTMVARE
eukprot:TRINITY_DN4887_c0_g1_i2.p1 TRINITY_DN4887_c0_g1~~TRINITY_DN4887_c0_g1_i2.p1  ORF type:complete len:648 (+),score=117.11 TRINITY_DN4887_c0_g1_i2:164-2107(+)